MIPGAGTFRVFPSKLNRQKFADDRSVCSSCLGGTCCSSEDPIALTSFDLLRLATFLDLSPAEFLLRFTQDWFDGEENDLTRRAWIDDPNSSVITFLRRRANARTSPCIFLKYVREPDGTPRRVCSVHDARPLACREYYYDTCKTRATGEIAALQAHGFEQIRRGKIGPTQVQKGLAQDNTDSMSARLELAFWTEMRRALDIDAANHEGANSFDIAQYQDPIDDKLNRMLSSPNLRFEEKYGTEPWGEQLHEYSSGRRFADSAERLRLLRLVRDKPRAGLFKGGDYPYYVASRFVVAGLEPPRRFRTLGAAERKRIVATSVIGMDGPVLDAALRAADALVNLAAYAAAVGRLLELSPGGAFERDVLFILARIKATRRAFWLLHPGLDEAARWARLSGPLPRTLRKRLRSSQRSNQAAVQRLLSSQRDDGTWNADPDSAFIPESQGEYWRGLLYDTGESLLALLSIGRAHRDQERG